VTAGPLVMPGPLSCPICGTPAVPGARFCFSCGAPLGVSAGEAAGDSGAERRVVTVLFGDLSEFTSWAEDLDPERVSILTDRVLAALTQSVVDFGGHVDKLTGDGIMAVFGAPTAHEDDAERAVRAAAQMQEQVRRLVAEESGGGRRLGLRVGLNTGEVLAGVQAALSYTVVGDTVNTASRLSDAAGVGGVLAGRDTALLTTEVASWRALPPLRLKGKREPVPAYELVRLRPAGGVRLGVGEEAPFIGREAEFGLLVGRLLGLVDAGEEARPDSVLVTGDAGIGKTRLAREIARFAGELPGSRLLWGRCAPYGEGRDLSPIVAMLRTASGIEENDDAETAAAKLQRAAARLEAPSYAGTSAGGAPAEMMLALLGLGGEAGDLGAPPAGASPGVPHGSPEPGLRAVAELFSSYAAEGPLVLVVDDVHWASDALLHALRTLARSLTGQVLLVALGRGELLGDQAEWAAALPDVEVLPLSPLDESATDRLLRAYLGGADLDRGARRRLLSRAGGNPFFLAELLHLLVDRGLLRREDERWRLVGEVPEEVLPAGVQAVLATRIDGLEPPVKAVLRDAAVIGVTVPMDALVAVARAAGHLDRERLRAAVDVLVDRGLLTVGPAGMLLFEHSLARDVAYAGVPKADRARRHAAVAGWALAESPGQPAEVDGLVAAHAEQALALAREMRLPPSDPAWRAAALAVTSLARLGQAALTRDDAVEAERLLSRAVGLAEERPRAVPAELVLTARVARARALTSLRRLDEAERELPPALESGEPGPRAAALIVLGDVRRRSGDDPGAREALREALAEAEAAGLDRLAGEALRQLGLLDFFAGRLGAAERRFGEALALAERVGDTRGAAWALQQLAWSATTRGDYRTADAAVERAADVFTALEDTAGLAWCVGTEGYIRMLQGRFAEARLLAGSLLMSGGTRGDRWGVAACLTIDAFAAAELGHLGVAAEEAARAREGFVSAGDSWGEVMALIAGGIAARGLGATDQAVALLREAVRLSETETHPATGAIALVVLGLASLDAGDPDTAERAALRAQEVLAGLDLEPHALVGARVLLAQVRRARGDVASALELLQEVAQAVDEPTMLYPRRQALAHLAGALLESGRCEEALATAGRALTVPAEDVRSRVVALRVLAGAEAACGDPAAARACVEEAAALAREAGLAAEAALTERAMAALPV
jgi:class 3 adenylate cyclase/tetratricopeptide (TPR) repeat protein